jgi:4-amino-4-deoxy-L-arabinose transferase-like glycosyltransferase
VEFDTSVGYVRVVSAPSPVGISRWSAPAWGAIATVVAFIAITCWWLTQDRSIPIYDAGYHLLAAVENHSLLQAGHLLGPVTYKSAYPPLAHVVGALAMFVGGVSVASSIIGENLVFVSLLALGCYQTGRLLYGPLAGMLAVVFALGAPLLVSLFHVFMLDGPLTALVAVSIWLILASEDFSHTGIAGMAGLAVGLGMNVKVQFALYVAGLVLVVLVHGGWRNKLGFALFAIIALVVGLPWYVVHFNELGLLTEQAGAISSDPRVLSIDNLMWYFWSGLNSQLLAPLFALAVVGAAWTVVAILRGRGRRAARLELLTGGLVAWAIITFVTPHHDTRYGLPLLAYIAVIGTGWIGSVSRPARLAGCAVLALGVCANVLGLDFGVGREVKLAVANDRVVLYTSKGFLVAGPTRDGNVPGLLVALRRAGVRTVAFGLEQSTRPDFSYQGVDALAQVAGLSPLITGGGDQYRRSSSFATLLHESVTAHSTQPCTRLSDGTGVWVIRYDAARHALALYCPTRTPKFYGSVAVS